VNNFGDLLGPLIVQRIRATQGLGRPARDGQVRLLTAGSIMRMARPGDVIWGTGVNGKSIGAQYSGLELDIRAVRGPLTRDVLERNGHRVPRVFGDPGLLVGSLWTPQELAAGWSSPDVVVVPNLHDLRTVPPLSNMIDPRRGVREVLGRIAASHFVVGSSLHAIVVAESLGIPARLVSSTFEPDFKYRDYYAGTGRAGFTAAATVTEAIRMGGELPPVWDRDALLDAFPSDLWLPAVRSAPARSTARDQRLSTSRPAHG
jgi:pyruvyltransferase